MTQSVLDGLVERLGKAQGPDRQLDYALFCHFAPMEVASAWHPLHGHKYTTSVDDALALVERIAPGGLLDLTLGYEPGAADKAWPAVTIRFYPPKAPVDGKSYHAQIKGAPTPALAICLTLLSALKSLEAL